MALTKVKLISDGVIVQSNLHASHGITTAHIGEGSNLYYTDARSRAAISVSGNALSYNSSTGVITSNFEENPVFTTGVTVANDAGHFTLFRTDGVTQLGKLYDDSGFTIEGKANNNLILRTKANSLGEGIKFQDTSSNDLMFIDGTNGRVGIGVTVPSEKLDVEGNIQAIKTGGGSVAYIDVVSGATWRFASNPISGTNAYGLNIIKGSAGTDVKMSIDTNGNVGIGDTNPSFVLDTNITSSRVRFKANTGDANIELSSIAGRDWLISSLTDGSLRFYDEDAASERMRIDSTGSVGIGTTNPGAKLEVAATATTSVDIAHFSNSNSVQKAIFKLSGVGAGQLVLRDAGNVEDVLISSHGDSYFNGGDVGIGQSNPTTLLHLYKFQADTQIRLQGSAGSYYITNDYSDDALTFIHNSTERMRIDSSGSVGIGTPDPQGLTSGVTTLCIRDAGSKVVGSKNGAISFQTNDASYTNTYSDGVTTEIYSISDSTTGSAYGLGFVTGTIGSAGRAERLRITSGGYVGIGTTSPSEKLHVNSGTGNVPALFESTDNLSLITFKDNNTTTDVGIGADDNDEVFYAGGSERMRIDSSGNVGIGATSPQANLDVNEDLRVNRYHKNIFKFFTTASASNQYFHIKTGVGTNQVCMHMYHVEGYAYGQNAIVDERFGFHTDGGGSIYGKSYKGSYANNIYKSSDNKVVLVFGPINTYYMSFMVHLIESGMYTELFVKPTAATYSSSNSGAY